MNERTRIILQIITILILIFLNIAVIINGLSLDCDKCKVKITSKGYEKEYKVSDLLDKLNKEECYESFKSP